MQMQDTNWSSYHSHVFPQDNQDLSSLPPAVPRTPPIQLPVQDAAPDPQAASSRVALVCPRKRKAGNGQSARQPDDPVVLTRELLEGLFDRSLASASEALGICPTAIKKACRRLGIDKWPYKGSAGRSSNSPTPPSSSSGSGKYAPSVEVSACEDLPLSSHQVNSFTICQRRFVPFKCDSMFTDFPHFHMQAEELHCKTEIGYSSSCQDAQHRPQLQRRDSLEKYARMLAVPPGEEGRGEAMFWKELLANLPAEAKGRSVVADFDFGCSV
uniref:RWP-RK domain-containing protein n=1 Tax=Hanusia phi TaxID=3032 RepID=A0A7S0EGS5_9CRYP|mmetsp:Transcript_24245/g.54524  ORF Transcript_24245/g.54524 Transcript_24245/m.54524 type:complete len:270 (+) Transcript_24245:149-958(+)